MDFDREAVSLARRLERTQWERALRLAPNGPILSRRDLQNMKVPRGAFEARSSGSTGMPVVVQRTEDSRVWWIATNILEALWFKRNPSLSIATIRPHIMSPSSAGSWGPAFEIMGHFGPSHAHPVKGDLNAWLRKVRPSYLSTFPSILETIDLEGQPQLLGIRTTGEVLRQKNKLIADTYSCEEVGTVAIQCPSGSGMYHVMENVVVEIVDEAGAPAASGRMLLTDLTSHYLRRYEVGDEAEWGVCSCGRGLQTIRRILGRRRNMIVLPDGSRHWPRVGSNEFRDVAPGIRRYQVTQKSTTELEVKLVTDVELTPSQEESLRKIVRKWTAPSFDVVLTRVDGFPPGKFEEFIGLP